MASMSTFSSKQLSEVDLKCLFLRHLREHNVINSNSVIASEYSLGHAGRRVDLAISCDKFIAVEFKSGADTLKRLQPQLDAYLRYFDRVIVVADERHIPGARAQIPSSVELWSVDAEGGLLPLQNSSSKSSRSTRALAQLCSTRQLKRLISALPSSTLSRSKLVEMAARAPFDLVHAAAIGAFKTSFARSRQIQRALRARHLREPQNS